MKIVLRQLRKLIRESINEATLNELGRGKNPYPFTRAFRGDGTGKVDNVLYTFKSDSPDEEKPGEYLTYKAIFKQSDHWDGTVLYEFGFAPVIHGVGDQYDFEAGTLGMLTNLRDYRIIETIIAILKDFATLPRDSFWKYSPSDDNSPIAVKFSGTSDSRSRLYLALIKRNIRSIPGAEWDTDPHSGAFIILLYETVPLMEFKDTGLSGDFSTTDLTGNLPPIAEPRGGGGGDDCDLGSPRFERVYDMVFDNYYRWIEINFPADQPYTVDSNPINEYSSYLASLGVDMTEFHNEMEMYEMLMTIIALYVCKTGARPGDVFLDPRPALRHWRE